MTELFDNLDTYAEQESYPPDNLHLVADTHGAMMGRSSLAPLLEETPHPTRETVAAVRVADVKYISRN